MCAQYSENAIKLINLFCKYTFNNQLLIEVKTIKKVILLEHTLPMESRIDPGARVLGAYDGRSQTPGNGNHQATRRRYAGQFLESRGTATYQPASVFSSAPTAGVGKTCAGDASGIGRSKCRGGGGQGGKAMSVNDLPAVMGTVLIVAGLVLVGVSTWSRAEGSDKTTQAGALIIVVGAFLLGLSIFVSHGK
jgi:hypothetical protein